jgi:hypothetical protein
MAKIIIKAPKTFKDIVKETRAAWGNFDSRTKIINKRNYNRAKEK